MTSVLLFGKLQDVSGLHSSELEIPTTLQNVKGLREFIDNSLQLDGALLSDTIRVAIDGEIAFDTAPFFEATEVAFMPPVGGG